MAEGAVRVTSRFERQHAELAALGKELLSHLDTRTLSVDAGPVRRLLAVFSGRLKVHAAMEEEALYPALLASGNARVAGKARELLDEVGGLYASFSEHLTRWAEPDVIRAAPEQFSRETMFLLHRLQMRMRREAQELCPLADRAGAA